MTDPETDPEQSTLRIPLVEEQAQVEKRQVETGRVRVRTIVDERQEWIHDAVAHGDVEVQRVTIDREVETMPDIRQEGDTVIIPIVDEVVVVEKRLVLREEVRLHRRTRMEPVDQQVTLRSTRAVVEHDRADPGTRFPTSKE